MEWMKQFIDETLREVPESGYRARAEAELRDHLETQYRALTESGMAEDEARSEALRTMGEPEKLQEEYRAAWRNTLESRLWGIAGWFGAVAAGGLLMYAASMFTLFPVTLAESLPALYQNRMFIAAAGSVTFLAPYALGAAFLRLALNRYRHRTAAVTAGLLVFWAASNWVLMVLGAAIDELDRLSPRVSMLAHFLDRPPLPWMTPLYHLLTFVGCVLLGQLFGRISAGKRKMAAA